MSLGRLKPWHLGLGLTALIALFVTLWPLGLGRDYMNHLARTFIEAELGRDAALQRYYALSFDFIPDLMMDLIIPWLSKAIGIYAAGGVTVWLAFVLPPLAGLALAKSLHGRVTWVSLLGFLTVFNGNMDWGFVNFNAAIGLALLAFVLWQTMLPGWRRTLIFAPIGLGLVVNHALAFLAFGFLALAWEVISFAHKERGSLLGFARQCVLVDLPAMALALAFIGLSIRGAADLPATLDPLYSPMLKTQALFAATQFGPAAIGLISAFALLGFFWVAIRQKWLVFADKTGALCAAFLGLVILMPTAVFGIWGLHLRYTGLLVVLVAACAVPTATFTRQARHVCLAAFAMVTMIAFANGAFQMAWIDRQNTKLRAVLTDLPRGAKVLTVYSEAEIDSAFTAHAGAVSVIERSAYVPNLFTNTSLVDVTPRMVDLHMPQAKPVFASELAELAARPPKASRNGYWSLDFAAAWPSRWDYLLYFKTPEQAGPDGFELCAVSATPAIILYKTGACPEG